MTVTDRVAWTIGPPALGLVVSAAAIASGSLLLGMVGCGSVAFPGERPAAASGSVPTPSGGATARSPSVADAGVADRAPSGGGGGAALVADPRAQTAGSSESVVARPATSLSPAEAFDRAAAFARASLPEAVVEPGTGVASCTDDRGCVWSFDLGVPSLALVVDDRTQACRLELDGQPWGVDAYGRFLAARRAVWAAVRARPEVGGLCDRLDYLATAPELPNLRGCVLWLEQFPPDLCTPEPNTDWQVDDSCLWSIYVGENMTDHTSRHWTYLVRARPARVVAVRGGFQSYAEVEWAKLQRARARLLRTLRSLPESGRLCRGAKGACPDVGEEAECENGCSWYVRFAVRGTLEELNVMTDDDGRPTGFRHGTREGSFAELRPVLAAFTPP